MSRRGYSSESPISAQLQVSWISNGPTQLPSPASSTRQFLCPASVGSHQFLGSSTICSMDAPRIFRSPLHMDPLSPPRVAEPITPPRFSDQLALPWLLLVTSALASRTFCVTWSHLLFGSAWVSTSISSISVCHLLVLPVMSLPWLLPFLIPSPPWFSCFCLLPGSFHYFRHSNFSRCHLLRPALCPIPKPPPSV